MKGIYARNRIKKFYARYGVEDGGESESEWEDAEDADDAEDEELEEGE